MKCSWIRAQLSNYVDGELCPLDVKKVDKHLLQCDSCQSEYEKIRDTSKLIGSLGEINPPVNFSEQVLDATTHETMQKKRKTQSSIFDRVLSLKQVAAVLIGVLLLGNGAIFAFYESGDYAEGNQQEIELNQEEHEEFLEQLAGVLDRDYYGMVSEEADVTMASSVGEVDLSRYEKNGGASKESEVTPFLIFNGAFLPLAATLLLVSKKSERGE